MCELRGEGTFRQHVRELGFGESTQVTKISGRSTIICQIKDTRIALSHAAASQIMVDPSAQSSAGYSQYGFVIHPSRSHTRHV
ncbi:MAG: ferrous iron transport protein A [Candidatus Synoicihabitans palmerolidicus]|nr:ferrous iron transport protein A [Candidatus Synoicihabitans palmerolidicus]